MDGCIYRTQFDMCEKNKEEDEKQGIRRWCDFDGCEDKHPSNADCIRSMTDKDLAEWLAKNDPECDPPEWWLDWLKKESE